MAGDKDKQYLRSSIRLWSVETFGYVVAGLSALATAIASIGHNFYKNIFEFPDAKIKAIKEAADARYHALNNPAAYTAERIKIRSDFMKEVDAHLKTQGITNIWHKWQHNFPHQKFQVGVTVAAVSSIALVAVLSMARSKALAKKIEQQEKEKTAGQTLV